jgi:hypothetical protein
MNIPKYNKLLTLIFGCFIYLSPGIGQIKNINEDGNNYIMREFKDLKTANKNYRIIFKKNKNNIKIGRYWHITVEDSTANFYVYNEEKDTNIIANYKIINSSYDQDKFYHYYSYQGVNTCVECGDTVAINNSIIKDEYKDYYDYFSSILLTHFNSKKKVEMILFKYDN